jgi:superfamily I DNA and/or RNA helicase
MHSILKSYLKRLTNLSGNNRSLLLLRQSAEQDISLHALDHILKNGSFSIIESLIAGKEISLCDVHDPRNESVNEISKRLNRILRRDKFIFEERGSCDLYVGWPFVRGKFSEGTSVRCPLLFFPVKLEVQNNGWRLIQREGVNISFNKSFLMAYSYFNEVRLEDDFIETSFENASPDSQIFRTAVYQMLKESPVNINFNPEIFVNQILSFDQFKKRGYEQKYKNGELILHPEAVLGIFPQAGSSLVPDYEELIRNNSFSDLEDFFISRSDLGDLEDMKNPTFTFIHRIKEEQTFTPYKLDASQENAIKALKKGNSLVVQGPPGTGKSQLICNVVADYIARGKKVLVVCQKRAALDVVYDRLKEKNLHDFAALVHDFRNDKKNIYSQLNDQVERLDEYKSKNNNLDSINLERSFVQASREIDQLGEELEDFRRALFDESDCGISVKELYLLSSHDEASVNLKQEFKFFRLEGIEKFSKIIRTYIPYSLKFDKSDYIWNDRVSFKDMNAGDLKKLIHFLNHIPFFQAQISEQIREKLTASFDMEDFEWYLEREEKIKQMIYLLEDAKTFRNFVYIANKNTDKDWLLITEQQIVQCFKNEGLEETLLPEQLGDFQRALEQAWQARKHFFKWFRWKLFSKDKFFVKRIFVANKLEWSREGFEELIRKVDNRMNFEHNLSALKECNWLLDVPVNKKAETFQDWIYYQHNAVAAKEMLIELRGLKDFLNIGSITFIELKEKLLFFVETIRQVFQERKMWLKFFTPRQVTRILSDYEYSIELKEVLKSDFESLVEFDKIKDSLFSYERDTMNKLLEGPEEKTIASVEKIFRNSVYLEWIDNIEVKYPQLRSVSSMKMEQMETELQEKIRQKLKVSKDIVLLRAREQTYKDLDFNRLNNMITYRELKHQVSKKSKVWPLRKLMENYSDEIFNLIPCWMTSPETVSAIFPMKQMFDLVIFDEASQCFSERGIPAMYRARQVMVTGDSQQLSPSDLYQLRWEDEEDESMDLEADSLLDLSEKYLMKVQLSSHYRSRSVELIDFSNIHFYKRTLRLLPDSQLLNASEPPIKYLKVNGIWENNTNRKEADEAVALLFKLLREEPDKSIGVVTFNFKQQNLILDLLEERSMAEKIVIPDSLFVKNIESVQGDERDTIIFSIGYAPDARGKFSAQFGSLNLARGENRLNVAVSRAKEKIYVISSIMPDQLQVEGSKNKGPGLLKEYLRFAWKVSEGKYEKTPDERKHKSEWYLSEKLEHEITLSLAQDLPFADLSVSDENKYLGIILTDDNGYQQSISAKDFHAYVPLSMEDKNWRYLKIYSRQYWENPSKVKDDIVRAFYLNH